MKSIIALTAAAVVSAVALPAAAQIIDLSPVTYEGSIGYTGISTSGADLGAVDLRASAFFGKYLGVEGEGAFGVNDNSASNGGAAAKLHLNSEYAGYGVVRYPVLPNANVFARVGYGHSDIKATVSSGTGAVSNSFGVDSVNYGAGGEYFFDDKNGIRIDYTRLDFQGHSGLKDGDSWSVGYVRRF